MPNTQPENDDLRPLLGEVNVDPSKQLAANTERDLGNELTDWADRQITPVAPTAAVWEQIAAQIATADKTSAPILSLRLWQIAALILLALNLFWAVLTLTRSEGPSLSRETASHDLKNADSPLANPQSGSIESSRDIADQKPLIEALESTLTETQIQVETLRKALADVHANAAAASAEHARILNQLDVFLQPVDGKAQLTLIAMGTNGDPISESSLNELLLNTSERLSFDDAAGAWQPFDDTPLPDPAALALWRSDLQEGVLNLYNIPQLPEGLAFEIIIEDAITGIPFSIGMLDSTEYGNLSIPITSDDPQFQPGRITVNAVIIDQATSEPESESQTILWGPENPNADPIPFDPTSP